MSISRHSMAVWACLTSTAFWMGGCAVSPRGAKSESRAIETYVRGVYAYQQGNKDEAADALREAIQENPQLIMPRVILGRMAKEKGDFSSAIEYFEALTQLDPNDTQHHYDLGVSYQMVRRLQEALRSYQKALQLNPDDFGSNMNLGLVYLALGDVDNAVRLTKKAAELRPDSAEAQANLAVALDSKGDYASAEVAYRRSLELAPAQVGTLTNYANNLLAQAKSQDAVQVLQELLKTQDTPYLHKRMGDALALGDQFDAAIHEYDEALKRNARYYSALNEKGRVLIQQYQAGMELEDKLRDTALGLWRQSLEISPNQPKVKALLEQWEKRMFSR